MNESENIEIAKHLNHAQKHTAKRSQRDRGQVLLEVFEAIVLAIVAIATAWSGYQSARWDGSSAHSYAEATALRVEAQKSTTVAGQQFLHDISTFNSWLDATLNGKDREAKMFERRFSADFKKAFVIWLETQPLTNDNAPPGPAYMPGYSNQLDLTSSELTERSEKSLANGHDRREIAEDYVRLTVFLATVLFLIALSQRFTHMRIRQALVGLAVVATVVTAAVLTTYPVH